jgi:hypothetical protein
MRRLKMRFVGSLAAALLFVLAGTSLADLAYASTAAAGGVTGTATITNAGNAAGVQNLTLATITRGATIPSTGTLTFTFAKANFAKGTNVDLVVYTGQYLNTTPPSLTAIVYTSSGGGTATYTGAAITMGASPTGNHKTIPVTTAQASYTIVGSFNWNAITNLSLTFSLGSGGGATGTFTVDAISNPEPGAIALFGVGAAGLAGLIVRRRRGRGARARLTSRLRSP